MPRHHAPRHSHWAHTPDQLVDFLRHLRALGDLPTVNAAATAAQLREPAAAAFLYERAAEADVDIVIEELALHRLKALRATRRELMAAGVDGVAMILPLPPEVLREFALAPKVCAFDSEHPEVPPWRPGPQPTPCRDAMEFRAFVRGASVILLDGFATPDGVFVRRSALYLLDGLKSDTRIGLHHRPDRFGDDNLAPDDIVARAARS
jgi:hypothetical protein